MAIRFMATSGSPERRRLRGLIADRQMRRLVSHLLPEKALDTGGRQARGQKRAFWWIRFFPGQIHSLEVVHERAEEVRQARACRRHRQVHLGREDSGLSIDARRKVEIL